MVNIYTLAEVTDPVFRTPVGVRINPIMRQMARGPNAFLREIEMG